MDSGDISKDELMGEASELLNKMKEMGGTEQFNDIMKNSLVVWVKMPSLMRH